MSFLNSVRNLLSVDMGIDMGTSRTYVYLRGNGVVLDEPSFIAVSYREGDVVAVGREAYKLFGRCPSHIEVLRPINKGIIENFELAESMLKGFLDRLFRRKALLGARISVIVPSGATDVERKAFEDVAMQVGAREVFLVETPVAAAIGMGLPLDHARGLVCFYIGGGTTQASVFSGGELLFTTSEPVGGEDLTEAIIAGIRRKYKIIVGTHTAEQLKVTMGSAFPVEKDETREVYGKSVEDGLPRAGFVANWELREMMKTPLNRIIDALKSTLEQIQPELAEDVKKNGLYLCGGGSQLRGMATLIEQVTKLKSITSKKGQLSCILGSERIINDLKRYGRFTTSAHSRQFT